jgi:hypothetical protein
LPRIISLIQAEQRRARFLRFRAIERAQNIYLKYNKI